MKTLLFLVFSALAIAQDAQNIFTIIPSTNSTGAPVAVGEILLRDLSLPANTAGLSPPNTITTSYQLYLPTGLSVGCLNVSSATSPAQITIVSCAGALPVPDTTIVTQNATDPTKQMRFDDVGISTGQTRVLSVQDFNYTLAGIDHTETFTADQTFAANILASGSQNIGSTSNAFDTVYAAFANVQQVQFVDGSFPLSHWQLGMDASIDPNLSLSDGIYTYWTQVLGHPGATWNINEHMLPGTADTYNLGSVSFEWDNLYVHNIVCTGSCGGLPVLDSTIITENASDTTKKMRFDNSGITTGNTSVLKVQQGNYTLAGINLAETWTADQTYNANILTGGGFNIGSLTQFWSNIYSNEFVGTTLEITDSTSFLNYYFLGENSGNLCWTFKGITTLQCQNTSALTMYEELDPHANNTYSLGNTTTAWNAVLYDTTVMDAVFPNTTNTGSIGTSSKNFNAGWFTQINTNDLEAVGGSSSDITIVSPAVFSNGIDSNLVPFTGSRSIGLVGTPWTNGFFTNLFVNQSNGCAAISGQQIVTTGCGLSAPGAWTGWSPSITGLSSSTISGARYYQLGKIIHFVLNVSGTGGGFNVNSSVPVGAYTGAGSGSFTSSCFGTAGGSAIGCSTNGPSGAGFNIVLDSGLVPTSGVSYTFVISGSYESN